MKILIGLGNPGKKYANTRHNVGHMLSDYLHNNLEKRAIVVAKSDEYMNNSGKSVIRLLQKYRVGLDDLYLIHDDLDISLGDYKIQKARGPKLHNGVESAEVYLNSSDFWRVRVGVDNRDRDNRVPGEEYVLQDFTPGELKTLSTTFHRILGEIAKL